jgi:hypothetical protein
LRYALICEAWSARMIYQKTAMRNREIFAAYQGGETMEGLAKRYGISVITIGQLIRSERHKIAFSVDGYYQVMRSQKLRLQP